MHADLVYKHTVETVLKEGKVKGDRTGTGTVDLFAPPQMRFNLKEGFPISTTKKIPLRVVFEELRWFLNFSTNLKPLLDNKVNIWTDDGYRFHKEQGGELSKEEFIEMVKRDGFDLGKLYPYNWRTWDKYIENEDGTITKGNPVDQIKNLIDTIRNDPNSRRLVVSAHNPPALDEAALNSCHALFQMDVTDGVLSCQMYQRSCDLFLGSWFNISSYALLTHMIAKMTGLEVGELVITIGSGHVYLNHLEQIKEQLSREPRPMPTLNIKTVHKNIEDYTFDDIELIGYDPHAPIKGKLSVGL
jgi:thymidylate synthase